MGDRPFFEISKRTRNLWVYTRKQISRDNPGLFQSYFQVFNAIMFLLAVLLEFYGYEKLLVDIRLPLSYVLLIILCDFLFFLAKHFFFQHKTTIAKCNDYLNDPEDGSERPDSGKLYRYCQHFFDVLLIGIAVLKLWFSFKVFSFSLNTVSFELIVIYGVVAIIHIYWSGYFIADVLFEISKTWDYYITYRKNVTKRNENGNISFEYGNGCITHKHRVHKFHAFGISQTNYVPLPTYINAGELQNVDDQNIQGTPCTYNGANKSLPYRHLILNHTNLVESILLSWGILTDADRNNLSNIMVDRKVINFVRKNIIQHQIGLLHDNPTKEADAAVDVNPYKIPVV